jgi:membrane protease YdiL (CAAX protease family)
MPLWGAVIVSSLIFGLGHEYQGVAGIMRTGLVGLLFAVLYVSSGSIWIPIIGHVLFDILQGKTILELFRDE